MIAIEDPHLPGLRDLCEAQLRSITGADAVQPVRLRYREGKRAILHYAVPGADAAISEQGAIWFFKGDKARRLARRNKSARFDQASSALCEVFPQDHRMPAIRNFLDQYPQIAQGLIGGRPDGQPKPLRYRPGLSCTFLCHRSDGESVFVKLINDDTPTRVALANDRMSKELGQGPVSVARVIGTLPALSAIAYEAAKGTPLDHLLTTAPDLAPVRQSIRALRRFWSLGITPTRILGEAELAGRAADAVTLVAATVPDALNAVQKVFDRITQSPSPRLSLRPIHGDMKLEHLFLEGSHTTLIDTESVSLGPPDYDLAQLYGRLWQAVVEGQLKPEFTAQAAAEVRSAAGPSFDWCLDVVGLRLAKFYAQRPGPESKAKIHTILDHLA